jgi:hypothetical protein
VVRLSILLHRRRAGLVVDTVAAPCDCLAIEYTRIFS